MKKVAIGYEHTAGGRGRENVTHFTPRNTRLDELLGFLGNKNKTKKTIDYIRIYNGSRY